jgi:hypothetical protein
LFCNIGSYNCDGITIADFTNFSFSTYEGFKSFHSSGPWALGVLLIVVSFLSLFSIMLYTKRMRQLRLTIMSSILLVGYILTYAFFVYVYNEKLALFSPEAEISFRLSIMGCMPAISLILNILAIHGIRKDEALVRSLDRIR